MKDHLQGIDTVILRVRDIALSKAWYADKLRFTPVYDDPIHKLVVLDTAGPTSLTIWQTDGEVVSSREGSAYPIFRTPDAGEAHRALSGAGVRTDAVITDHVVTYFRFYDPDGNVLEACQVH